MKTFHNWVLCGKLKIAGAALLRRNISCMHQQLWKIVICLRLCERLIVSSNRNASNLLRLILRSITSEKVFFYSFRKNGLFLLFLTYKKIVCVCEFKGSKNANIENGKSFSWIFSSITLTWYPINNFKFYCLYLQLLW